LNKLAENLFAPFSYLFSGAVFGRNQFYERGIFRQIDLGAFVVSVGNLTVGGTGKTPIVAAVAKILSRQNHRVCVLTRGYKRAHSHKRILVSDAAEIFADARAAGDEAFELAQTLRGIAAVVADKKRAEAGIWARQNLKTTAFVLDDGFQHRRVRRDLDIVTIDALNPFGNGRLLPGGILREPKNALLRADCVVITRADLSETVANLKFQISKINPQIPILLARNRITNLREITNPEIQNPKSKTALAFCALGNPQNFFIGLQRGGFQIVETKKFLDHHVYVQNDITQIERAARAAGAEILLTTAKDAVKLSDLKFDLPCFVVEIEIVFDKEKVLFEMLSKS
jgi:tetraacyldisaccharide 4'-kinase